MNVVKEIQRINERELEIGGGTSWHDEYKDSAYVFVGGLDYTLTEGDVLAVFSQYGEISDLNLVRDKDTGKPKGFAFIGFEDQRSTVLAVDNFNGIKLLNRTLRVDHCKDYKHKDLDPEDETTVDAKSLLAQQLRPKAESASDGEGEALGAPRHHRKKHKHKKKKKKTKTKHAETDPAAPVPAPAAPAPAPTSAAPAAREPASRDDSHRTSHRDRDRHRDRDEGRDRRRRSRSRSPPRSRHRHHHRHPREDSPPRRRRDRSRSRSPRR